MTYRLSLCVGFLGPFSQYKKSTKLAKRLHVMLPRHITLLGNTYSAVVRDCLYEANWLLVEAPCCSEEPLYSSR